MSSIDERIKDKTQEAEDLKSQVEICDKQIVTLKNRREQLIIGYHRADAALATLRELKTEAEPAEEGT